MGGLIEYKYKGALALIELHEKQLKQFAELWRKGKETGVVLRVTEDTDYQSMESLLRHVLRSARGYMVWICEKLNLPDPGIAPPPDDIAAGMDAYINHLIEMWRVPLAGLDEELFHGNIYLSNWGTGYCIDAMLEHAVMHPARHGHQLLKLMEVQKLK